MEQQYSQIYYSADRFINEQKFIEICNRYEISIMFRQYIRELIYYKIIIIADDSGSMTTLTRFNESRWAELCKFITLVFSITEIMENNLIDIHFLNRGSITGIKELKTITNAFIKEPSGPTPIVPILRRVLNEPIESELNYKGRIIIIATDGEPTDDNNRSDIRRLKNVLLNERKINDYVSFLACTDDDNSIEYLNKWDKEIARVDVMDDYPNEKIEVLRAQGRNFSFTYGDYVVKTLLGSVKIELDRLDEIHDDCQCNIL